MLDILKNKRILICAVLLLFGLVFIFASGADGNSEKDSADMTLEEYKTQKEKQLSELCSSIRGVGRCSVTLSFKKGYENTYRGTALLESKPPEVLGVAVVCRGADSERVRGELTELFSALFAIPSTRIAILKLN